MIVSGRTLPKRTGFFEQIKEKASKDQQVIQTAVANPKDKLKIGIRKLIEGLMIQRLGENDKIHSVRSAMSHHRRRRPIHRDLSPAERIFSRLWCAWPRVFKHAGIDHWSVEFFHDVRRNQDGRTLALSRVPGHPFCKIEH